MRVLTVLGARPQFIKAAVVSKSIANKEGVSEVIVHTGQHFDANMSDIFFEQMSIPRPGYNLDISGLNHGAMTGRMLESIEEIIVAEQPDSMMVYGDTNSTLAGALAASKLHIPVIHVEAGLRSFNMNMPEEVNRILTDRVSSVLHCPTQTAVENLSNEGFPFSGQKVVISGDVMEDAAKHFSGLAVPPASLPATLLEQDFVLCTIHRAENTDNKDRLTSLVDSINEINQQQPVILPLHPRTRNIIKKLGLTIDAHVIDPIGYLEMLYMLRHCRLVMSDSGGVQKEAFFFNKPCITLRDETEWVELVDLGVNFLVGADKAKLSSAYEKALVADVYNDGSLYGGGTAGEKIVKAFS